MRDTGEGVCALFRADGDAMEAFRRIRIAAGRTGQAHRFMTVGEEGRGERWCPPAGADDLSARRLGAAARLVVDARVAGDVLASGAGADTVLVALCAGAATARLRRAASAVAVSPAAAGHWPEAAVAPLPAPEGIPEFRLAEWPPRIELVLDENKETAELARRLVDALGRIAGPVPVALQAAGRAVGLLGPLVEAARGNGANLSLVAAGRPATVAVDMRPGGGLGAELDWSRLAAEGVVPALYMGEGDEGEPRLALPTGGTLGLATLLTDRAGCEAALRAAGDWLAATARAADAFWRGVFRGTAAAPAGRLWWSAAMLDAAGASQDPLVIARLARLRPADAGVALRQATLALGQGRIAAALDAIALARRNVAADDLPALTDAERRLWLQQRIAPSAACRAELAEAHAFVGALPVRPRASEPRSREGAAEAPFGAVRQFGLERETLRAWGVDHPGIYWSEGGFTLLFGGDPASGHARSTLRIAGAVPRGAVLEALDVTWRGRPLEGVLETLGDDFRFTAPFESGGTGPLTLSVKPAVVQRKEGAAGIVVRTVEIREPEAGAFGVPPLHTVWLEKLPADASLDVPEYRESGVVRWLAGRVSIPLPLLAVPQEGSLWLVVRLAKVLGEPPDHLLAAVDFEPVALDRMEGGEDGYDYGAEISGLAAAIAAGADLALDVPGPVLPVGPNDPRFGKALLSSVALHAVPAGALGLPAADLVQLSPDSSAFATGTWHDLETYDGQPARWSRERSVIRGSRPWQLRRGDVVRLAGRFAVEGALEGLAVEVNGLGVEPLEIDRRPDGWTFSGRIACDRPRLVASPQIALTPGAARQLSATDSRVAALYVTSAALERAAPDDEAIVPGLQLERDKPFEGALLWEDWGGSLKGFWIGSTATLCLFVPSGAGEIVLNGAAAVEARMVKDLAVSLAGDGLAPTGTELRADGSWSAAFALPDAERPAAPSTLELALPEDGAGPSRPRLILSAVDVRQHGPEGRA